MKTLYIDINNTPIANTPELEVLSIDLKRDFYYSLGESVKGRVRGISSNIDLIADYMSSGEDATGINQAWKQVKEILFSDNPEEDVIISLPQSYLEWLRYNNNDSYRNIYEQLYSGQRSVSVTINMEELYEDAISGTLYRKIRRYLKDDVDIEAFVFNDNCINRKSAIVRKLKEDFEDVGFIPFEKLCKTETPVQESYSKDQEKLTEHQMDNNGKDNLLIPFENEPIRFITFEEYQDKDDEDERYTQYIFNVLDFNKKVIHEDVSIKSSVLGTIPFVHLGIWDGHSYIVLETWRGHCEITANDISSDAPRWKNYLNRDDICGYCDSFISKPVKKSKNCCVYDILDRVTGRKIVTNIKDPYGFHELCEGWATLNVEVLTMVLSKNTSFYLDENEYVYNDTFTDGSSYPNPEYPIEPIKDNRIITLEMHDNEIAWDNCRVIKVRDEKGNIIKELPPNILIKQSYRFGKALAIDTDTNSLVYVDKDGNIHDLNHYVNGNPFEFKCLFASSETVCCVKDAEEDYPFLVLQKLDGTILFEEAYDMRFLSEGYIEYTDKHSYKKGLIDGYGNLILYPKYYQIEILK